MPSSFVDLHCHSTASDGTLPPAQVVRLAVDRCLSALALTDHDTVAGIAEAAAEAKRLVLDFLPGIEISAEFPHPGTMHLLGYGVDPRAGLAAQDLAGLAALGTRFVALYDYGGRPQGSKGVEACAPAGLAEVEDLSGEAVAWLRDTGAKRGHVALIRPDKFVYALTGPGSVAAAVAHALRAMKTGRITA